MSQIMPALLVTLQREASLRPKQDHNMTKKQLAYSLRLSLAAATTFQEQAPVLQLVP